MRPTFVVTAAVLLLSIGTANAADSTQLAETDGFLLGSAHRCSVPTDRVEHARKVIHDLIVAASDDSTEEAAADSHFAQMFMASSSASRHELTRNRPCFVMMTRLITGNSLKETDNVAKQTSHVTWAPFVIHG
jgi:hypothetical protein